MRIIIALAIGALVLMILASGALPAQAQGVACKPHDAYLQMLADKYGERVVAFGIVTLDGEPDGKPAALMELTASAARSWTFVLTDVHTGCATPMLSGGKFGLKRAERGA